LIEGGLGWGLGVNIKPCCRRRVRSTVAGERVPVYRQQPFNPMPEGYCELLRISFFFWGTFFFFLASQIRKKKKVQIKKGFCIKISILMY